MGNPALTHRTVSQVQKISNWKVDKMSTLASLEDFQKYSVGDLDFFDKNDAVLASFVNFSTEDIIQTGDFVRSPAQEASEFQPRSTDIDAIRLYYGKGEYGGAAASAPEVVSSPLLAIDVVYTGVEVEDIVPSATYGIAFLDSFTTPAIFWDHEEDTFEFEAGFQHDIYGAVIRDEVATVYNEGEEDEYTRYIPVPLIEAFDINTTYYYMILDTVAESTTYNISGEVGLNWGVGKAADGLNYTWTVVTPPWTEIDLVFNESRYWGKDKINRF